jgi:hypothetical protein
MLAILARTICDVGSIRLRRSLWLLIVLSVAVTAGCGRRGDLPLDQDLAKKSLVTALDAWKAAKKPADLATGEPKIIVSQPLWQANYKLDRYDIQEPPTNDGSNLHFRVKLTTTDPAGKWEQRDVTCIVGTSPVITISMIDDSI